MALDFGQMLLQPSAVRPWNLSGGGSSSSREQLKLAREQFEETKRRNREAAEWAKTEEAGRNARSALEAEEAKRKEEAARQATLLAQQQAAVQKFGELAGTGKVQQAQAMVPYLDQLGYSVETLGGVGGLPVFALKNRAEEAAREEREFDTKPRAIDGWEGGESANQSLTRMGEEGLGYPTNERGQLDEPAGIPFTEDAYGQALAASQAARETGAPVRGADEEDYQGAVPRNVIDLPAMQAETLARLNPALRARLGMLPDELRERAEEVGLAESIGGLGLEAGDALKEMDTALQDPVSIYNQQLNLDAQKEKRDDLSRKDKAAMYGDGDMLASKLITERGFSKVLDAVVKADEVERVLDDGTPENDRMIAPALMAAQGVEGVPSNTDLQFAFNAKSSLIGDIIAKVEEAVQGGLSTAQRKAIRDYLKAVRVSQGEKVEAFLDSAYQRLDSGKMDPEVAKGYLDRIEQSVPGSMYNDYWDAREKREKESGRKSGRPGATSQDDGDGFGKELDRQASASDLDPAKIRIVMGPESGGRADATSSQGARGILQIMPFNTAALGTTPEELGKMTRTQQIPYALKYLKDRGITAESSEEDYALAVAAPAFIGKPDNAVVYKKDSDDWKANPAWRPADGGDITVESILKFYGLRGTKAEKAGAAPEKRTELKMPEPKTPAEKRIQELMRKAGG